MQDKISKDRVNLYLRIFAVIFASLSLAALIFHVFGLIPIPFFLEFFGVPALFLLFTLAAIARKIKARAFLNGLTVGLWAGVAATLVYDGVRTVVERSHIFGYSGFVPIYMFGSWITGQPVNSLAAGIAGWTYHYWNGLSFAVMYVLIFGNRHWLIGVGYGIVMELCMLGIYPIFLHPKDKFGFVALSMIGHLAYGAVLGKLSARYATFR